MSLLTIVPKVAKICMSDGYNYSMNLKNGYFERWGKTKQDEDDPSFSPIGPEILDLEISTSVHGDGNGTYNSSELVHDGGCLGNCNFCYKSNGIYPTHNMTFENFKTVFHKIGEQLTQVAFGIMNLKTNPDFFKMAKYARHHNVIPNFTMHGLDDISNSDIKEIARIFGAVAVSYYQPEKTMNLVKRLTDAGMKQVNIHHVISDETYDKAVNLVVNIREDERLKNLRSVVLLSLKIKGDAKRNGYHILSHDKYSTLMDIIMGFGINVGFDSCGAHRFSDYMHSIGKTKYDNMIEPCESGCFSSYVNTLGDFYPCSFTEGEGIKGQSVLKCENFLDEVWNSDITKGFRNRLIASDRHCPVFKI